MVRVRTLAGASPSLPTTDVRHSHVFLDLVRHSQVFLDGSAGSRPELVESKQVSRPPHYHDVLDRTHAPFSVSGSGSSRRSGRRDSAAGGTCAEMLLAASTPGVEPGSSHAFAIDTGLVRVIPNGDCMCPTNSLGTRRQFPNLRHTAAYGDIDPSELPFADKGHSATPRPSHWNAGLMDNRHYPSSLYCSLSQRLSERPTATNSAYCIR